MPKTTLPIQFYVSLERQVLYGRLLQAQRHQGNHLVHHIRGLEFHWKGPLRGRHDG